MRVFVLTSLTIGLVTLLFVSAAVAADEINSDKEDINRQLTLYDVDSSDDGHKITSGRKVRQFGFPGFGGGFGGPGFGGPGFGGPGFGGRGFGGPGFGGPGFGGPGFGRFGGGFGRRGFGGGGREIVRERVRVVERTRVRQRPSNGFGGGFFG